MTVDFNLVSFALAILSLVLGGFAIYQAREYRNESQSTLEKTRELLGEIKVHSVIISQYALPELRAYGESIRAHLFQQQTVSTEKAAKETATAASANQSVREGEEKNIRQDLMEEIVFLKKHTGHAISVELFDRLKHRYDFGTVLSELFAMQKAGLVSWAEAPNSPDALSVIELTG